MALEAMGKKTISGACCESNEEVKVTPPARPKRAKNKLNGNLSQQPAEEDKNIKLNVKEASSNGSLSTDDFQDTKMEPNPSAANSDLKSQISALKNSGSREAGNGMSMMSNKRSFGTSLEYSAADVDIQFAEKKYFEKESKEVAETFNAVRDIKEERRVDFESCVSPDIAGGSQDEESFFSAEETENTSEFISLSSYNLKESLNEGCTKSEGSQALSSLNAEETNAKDETSTGFNSPAKRDQDISRIQIHSTEDSANGPANHANTTEKVENSCSSDEALSEVSGLLNSRGAVAALSNNSGHNHTSTTASPGCPPDPDLSGAVGRDFETDTESEEDLSSSTDTSSEGEYDVHLYEHHHGLILEEDFENDGEDRLNDILSAFPGGTQLVSVTTDSEDDSNRGDTPRNTLKSSGHSNSNLCNDVNDDDESDADMSNMLACFSPKSECPVVLDNVPESMDAPVVKKSGSFQTIQNNCGSQKTLPAKEAPFKSEGLKEAEDLTNKYPLDTLIDNKDTVGYDCVDGMGMPQNTLSEPKIYSEEFKRAGDNTATPDRMNTECLRANDFKIKNEGDNSEIHSAEQGRFAISKKIVDEPALKLTSVTTGESPTGIEGDCQAKMEGTGKDLVDAGVPDIKGRKKKPRKVTIGNGYSIDSGTGIILSPEDDSPAELKKFVNTGSFYAARGQPVTTEAQTGKAEVTDGGPEGDTSSSQLSKYSAGRQKLGYSESFSPGDTATILHTSVGSSKRGKDKRRSKTLPNNVFDLKLFKTSNSPPEQMGQITLITDNVPATFPGFPINRRAQVALELYTTERSYVRRLETVLQLFKKPCEENNYLDKKELVTMFMNIEDVYAVNKDLLFMLLERISHWNDQQCVGDLFLDQSFKIIDRMKIYTKYCNNYPAAEKLYKDKIKKKEFEAFIHSCYEHQVCQAGLNLPAYLISVVQRIPRYLLLLQDLLKRTPENHPDYGNLSKAFAKMENLAVYINNQKQTADGMKAMEQLRLRVEGLKALEGRALIKEADVVLNGTKKVRQAWLLNDMLVFAAKGVSRSSEVEKTLDLATLWCMDLGGDNPQSAKEDSLEIYTPEHSYIMYAGTKNEKKVWLQKLRTAVAQALHGEEANESYEIESRKATFTYKDGRNYCGNLVSGKRHGHGTLSWPNQAKYQGDWRDDDRCGVGELLYNCGDKYKGQWLDDKQHGTGTLHYINGDVYHGQWFEGDMHGKGTINFKNGDHFEGDFDHNEIHGDGELICDNGLIYKGKWEQSKKHGKGWMHFPNGDVYSGDFANDQCNGHGEMHYADGSFYKGQWVDNRRGGEGEFRSSDGTFYTGGWSKDLINGPGRMEYSNGDCYNGNWFKNTRYGQGVMKYSNGDVYNGGFEYDLCSKNGKMTYKDGSVYEGLWSNGLRHGEGKMSYANKSVYEGRWFYGMRHYEGVLTYANHASYHGQWDFDKQQGRGMYKDLDSGYHYEGEWKNGLKHGKGVEKTKEGRYEGEWKDNMRHGQGTEVLSCGTIYEGRWKENKKHGVGTKKLKSGMVEKQSWYEGKQVDITSTDVIELPLIQRR